MCFKCNALHFYVSNKTTIVVSSEKPVAANSSPAGQLVMLMMEEVTERETERRKLSNSKVGRLV